MTVTARLGATVETTGKVGLLPGSDTARALYALLSTGLGREDCPNWRAALTAAATLAVAVRRGTTMPVTVECAGNGIENVDFQQEIRALLPQDLLHATAILNDYRSPRYVLRTRRDLVAGEVRTSISVYEDHVCGFTTGAAGGLAPHLPEVPLEVVLAGQP